MGLKQDDLEFGLDPQAAVRQGGGIHAPVSPHVIVLFGATGDLTRRKLLPGLYKLSVAGPAPRMPHHRHFTR